MDIVALFELGVFKALLEKLHENQSWCPYCGGRCTHYEKCVLLGRWFRDETKGTMYNPPGGTP